MVFAGDDVDFVVQQHRQALNDGKAEAQPFAPVTGRIANLMEFLKNQVQLIRRNADAGVPDLDADAAPTTRTTSPSPSRSGRL